MLPISGRILRVLRIADALSGCTPFEVTLQTKSYILTNRKFINVV